MKYPLKESDFKTEEKTTTFERGKWYRCIKSSTPRFSCGHYYLCVKDHRESELYLVDGYGFLFVVGCASPEFSGPH